ncbi:MAG TPA: hypothetical protein VIH46_10160 [Candidatus Acidoferrales bacterium]
MRYLLLIFACSCWLSSPATPSARAQVPAPAPAPAASSGQTVDAVAARIEDDILTESEVRELGAFQKLVDGSEKPRAERIRELADQWIVRGEIETAKYPAPSDADADRAYAQLEAQYSSPEEFTTRCAAAGLTRTAVRRMLVEQLYLSRFLDFRFRPAAQIDEKQLETYYDKEFAPQLKARNEPVPPLEDVEDTIREVLIQRAISERATQWLDDTRSRLKIDVMSDGAQP